MYPPILTRGKRVEIADVDNTRERQTRQGARINRQRQRQRQRQKIRQDLIVIDKTKLFEV
jgi:hypothetical protein